ncbi:MAG: dihydroorotate dehydrogenase [Candidatus Eisenbacteria bacterium]|nr:dihydroorotate dehydrogenase [Candidatus Eisenbacteria bacterium]
MSRQRRESTTPAQGRRGSRGRPARSVSAGAGGARLPDLSVRIAGLRLSTPVLLASGVAGYGEEMGEVVDLNRVGAIVTKTLTPEERAGNPPPRLFETPAGLMNNIGLANVGLEGFLAEVLPQLKRHRTRIVVSVGGFSLRDYEKVLASVDAAGGAHAFEINVSCPNVRAGGIHFGCSASRAARVVRALRPLTALPLLVKLTPNVTDIGSVAAACVSEGADGLTVANTYTALAVDLRTRRPRLGGVTGGLSGPAVKPLSLAKVWEVTSRVKAPVIACGGISTAEDALEYIVVGATAVQVGTACFRSFKTPELIVNGIIAYMKENSLSSLQELRGTMTLAPAE